jgi:hypothetical protein
MDALKVFVAWLWVGPGRYEVRLDGETMHRCSSPEGCRDWIEWYRTYAIQQGIEIVDC